MIESFTAHNATIATAASIWRPLAPTQDAIAIDGLTFSEEPFRCLDPITLFTGQWADLPFEEVCRLASGWGYDGLEVACWGDHLDVRRAAEDDDYVAERKAILESHGLGLWAISNHLVGQAVCDDPIDARHQAIVPAARVGRRRPRRGAPAGRRRDEGDRPGRREARRRHRHRVHRFGGVEVRGDVPAGAASR